MSGGPRPALSVVIAAGDSAEAVRRTIATLGPIGPGVEVIVAATFPPDEGPAEGVTWVEVGRGYSVAKLRGAGLGVARGEVVAFTEDSCVLSAGWAGAWRAAFEDRNVDAATGPVVPVLGVRPWDWAVFFCEYGSFLPGAPSGRLAGNNFAVRRGSLDPGEVDECEVGGRLAGSMAYVPGAAVGHGRRYGLAQAIRDRLRFGLGYGYRRNLTRPREVRACGVVAGPLVFAAQVVRLCGAMASKRSHAGPFVETMPVTLALLCAWSVGEWVGWVRALASRIRHETVARPCEPPWPRVGSRRPRYTAGRARV
jgi:hypothetical protein